MFKRHMQAHLHTNTVTIDLLVGISHVTEEKKSISEGIRTILFGHLKDAFLVAIFFPGNIQTRKRTVCNLYNY